MFVRMNFFTKSLMFCAKTRYSQDLKKQLNPSRPILHFPEYTHLIEGERVYSSEGRLHSIVNISNDYKTIYVFDKKYDGLFTEIITIDMKSNSIIKRQVNEIENGAYDDIEIVEYSPKTGEKIASCSYDNGVLEHAVRVYYDSKGKKHIITYNKK